MKKGRGGDVAKRKNGDRRPSHTRVTSISGTALGAGNSEAAGMEAARLWVGSLVTWVIRGLTRKVSFKVLYQHSESCREMFFYRLSLFSLGLLVTNYETHAQLTVFAVSTQAEVHGYARPLLSC